MASPVAQWIAEALQDIAADQVDRVVVRTNLGTITVTKPIEASGVPTRRGPGAYLTELLAPRVEVYLVNNRAKPAFTYMPGKAPNPALANSGIVTTAVAALALVGVLSVIRGLTR